MPFSLLSRQKGLIKIKILLVAPYKNTSLGVAKFPPLGLGYLAGGLRKAGYPVKILDCLKEGLNCRGYRDSILKERPDIVGVNSWSCSVKEVKEILAATKETDKRIITIVGGPHPSAVPDEAMDYFSDADFGFKGEAEIGLPMLVEALSGNEKSRLGNIPGLIWNDGRQRNINEQVFCGNLDDFDYLAWDLIKPEEYVELGSANFVKTAPIITSRGCPHHCTFCSAHIISGYKIRYRSLENIIGELKILKERHGIKRVNIMDENFTFNKNHVLSFCDRVIGEKLDLEFTLPQGVRLDALDEELLLRMKRARFSPNIALGIESGSQRLLGMIKKNIDKDMVKDKTDLMRRLGFRPVGYFILGFPTETKEEMYETLKFAKEMKFYRAAFSPLLILPNTEIYEYLKNNNQLPAGYDFSSLVTDRIMYAPSGMTLEEFSRIRKDIIMKFNLQPRVIFDYMRDWNSFAFAIKRAIGVFFKNNKISKNTRN